MGIYLSTPNKEKNPEDINYQNKRCGACSMQGWRVSMEDAHITRFNICKDIEDVHLFGVFDGHGGKEVAKFVEKHFVDELLASESFRKADYEQALKTTFLKMDQLLLTPEGKKELHQYKNSDDHSGESMAGCTANVALIVKNQMYVANAGDSRCVLSSKGNAVEMSHDHKPDLQTEKDRITKAGGYITDGRVNGNLNLSRAIGDLEYKKDSNLSEKEQLITAYPDVKTRELTADDEFFILGCDGIWEILSNQDIVTFVGERLKKLPMISNVCEELMEKIVAPDTATGLGCDNMTCIIVSLK